MFKIFNIFKNPSTNANKKSLHCMSEPSLKKIKLERSTLDSINKKLIQILISNISKVENISKFSKVENIKK
jgi:hypothetical protein